MKGKLLSNVITQAVVMCENIIKNNLYYIKGLKLPEKKLN